ncbi:MAG: hypothetical protein IVW52_04845 [Acidimicrobiales bacterium]|nr:hypothetical protein [Acidimicrobiales bacterium]
MADADERLRCWAAGARARRDLRELADIAEEVIAAGPGRAHTPESRAEHRAAMYGDRYEAVEKDVADATACGESSIALSWVGQWREGEGLIRDPPRSDQDAREAFSAIHNVLNWMDRESLMAPRPGTGLPYTGGGTEHAVRPAPPPAELERAENEAGGLRAAYLRAKAASDKRPFDTVLARRTVRAEEAYGQASLRVTGLRELAESG